MRTELGACEPCASQRRWGVDQRHMASTTQLEQQAMAASAQARAAELAGGHNRQRDVSLASGVVARAGALGPPVRDHARGAGELRAAGPRMHLVLGSGMVGRRGAWWMVEGVCSTLDLARSAASAATAGCKLQAFPCGRGTRQPAL